MVKELIEAGAQIDNKNEDEQTPLHIAASEGRLNIVQCILSYDRYSVNDEDFESQTALHLASTKVEPIYYFAIFCNTASVGIFPDRSIPQGKKSSNWTFKSTKWNY